MATGNTSLLGLALPVEGELDGTWGDVVNDSITSLVDSAVAGTTTLSTDADVTLTDTTLAANQARQAVLLWTASNGATTRNITAPARSKPYIVINAGTGSVVLRGAGPTTGVTVAASEKCLAAWNGSDFVKIATSVVDGVSTFSAGTTGFTPSTDTSGAVTLAGTLNVANGGTGATTLTANNVLLGNGTSALQVVAPGTSGNVLTSNGTTWASTAMPAGVSLSVANTWTALQTFSVGSVSTPERETAVSLTGTAIDVATGNYFYKTIAANTTFTLTNSPASGTAQAFVLELTNGGAYTITWFANLTFPYGIAPTLTASGRDVLAFFTRDGGTTWSGFVIGKDVKGP